MTASWPLLLFSNLIDMSDNNSHISWTHCNQQWNASKIKSFKTKQILPRNWLPRAIISAHLVQNVQSKVKKNSTSSITHKALQLTTIRYHRQQNCNPLQYLKVFKLIADK
ncbi:hypothetical protein T4B_6594 [Trichinella pseudospiralis]|uniref:PiggyBac transposable element-derived protein domain-containing protein n=1 Tax=Trichinella pseudospiralis TaxID=6337 RepID=A0A0V1HVP0_TRIPS|nr:hypothetical protein T4B_6594 [Trichinella pseudospiralis]